MKLFTKIFTAVFLTVASIFYFSGVIPFTSAAVQFNPVQSAPAYLSGAGITAVQTTIPITSFVTRQGTPITTANIGGIGYATIDAGTSKEENISFTGVTQNINGTAVLTGASRGLQDVYPYTATTSLAIAHSGGATVITSNSGAFYSQFNIAPNPSTVTGLWTFDPSAIPSYSSAPTFSNSLQIIDKAYVDSVATSGAPDASQSAKGLVQIATPSQIASGTATTTDGTQTLWNVVSAGQYGKTYGATPTVTTNNYGNATGTGSTTYTGSFTLPTNGTWLNGHYVSSSVSMVVTLNGTNGGTANGAGGAGGQTVGTIATPVLGTSYYIGTNAGGGIGGAAGTGTGGSVGGPGGGMAWFSANSSYSNANVLMVAAGGGGGGGVGYINGGGYGGNGGGLTGNIGAKNGCLDFQVAATQSAAGTVSSSCGSPTNGAVGSGGNGGAGISEGSQSGGGGGGGGAGYYGGAGGSGGTNNGGGYGGNGGQGGASYIAASTFTSTSTTQGGSTGGGATIVFTYSYNDPTESVSSTVSGNNFGGTVTVSAATTHLSPTTSTINFAPWAFQNAPSGVSCNATTWGSSLAPFIIAENTSSVEFGFGSTIAGREYDYNCLPR